MIRLQERTLKKSFIVRLWHDMKRQTPYVCIVIQKSVIALSQTGAWSNTTTKYTVSVHLILIVTHSKIDTIGECLYYSLVLHVPTSIGSFFFYPDPHAKLNMGWLLFKL